MICLSPCVFQFRVLFPVFHNPQFPWNLLARLRRQHTMLRIWNTNPTSHWPSSTMLLGVEKSILSIPFTVWISLGYPTNTVAALGDPRVDCSRITKRYTHTHTHTTHIYIYFPFSLYLYIYIMYTYAAGAMEPWILRFGLPATDTLANCYVKVVILEVLRIYICFVDFQECLRGVPVQNPFCPFHAVNTLSLNLPWAMGFSGWFLAPGPHLLFYLRDAWHAVRGWRLHRGIWFC